jgi:predicted lipid carrier protein YhbT
MVIGTANQASKCARPDTTRKIMQASSSKLPPPVAKILSGLPAFPGSWLFVQALNLAFKAHLPDDVRAMLVTKKLRLRVNDAGVAFDFEWHLDAFRASAAHPVPDLTIGATAHDLLLLARRQEDPDTLFFNRRLTLEGDVELGLLVKNTLDAIDGSAFELGKAAVQRLLSRWRLPLPGAPAKH